MKGESVLLLSQKSVSFRTTRQWFMNYEIIQSVKHYYNFDFLLLSSVIK